jgi:hypothetical protein
MAAQDIGGVVAAAGPRSGVPRRGVDDQGGVKPGGVSSSASSGVSCRLPSTMQGLGGGPSSIAATESTARVTEI